MLKRSLVTLSLLTLGCSLLGSQSAQAVELERGAMLSASCEGCHGTNGRSPGTIPAISGRSADYLMKAFSGFKSGERAATVMGRHVRGYTDEELQLIADYLSQQKAASE